MSLVTIPSLSHSKLNKPFLVPNVGFNLSSSGQRNESFVTDLNRLKSENSNKSEVVTKTRDQGIELAKFHYSYTVKLEKTTSSE